MEPPSLGCSRFLAALGEADRLAVIHHWDADGVASAALLLRRLGGRVVETLVPRIGRYSFDALPLPRGAAAVAVLDYGVDGRVYDEYAMALAPTRLAVLDHHRVAPPTRLGAYCNPVAEGRGGEEAYPAASLLLYRLLRGSGAASGVLAALGVAGDLAPFIDAGRGHSGLEEASRLASAAGTDLAALRRLAEMIDSCYRLLDYSCIRRVVGVAAEDPLSLLDDPVLLERWERSRSLLDEALERVTLVEKLPGLIVYSLELDGYVTSAVGRRLATLHPNDIVVLVHTIPREGGGFIYARSISRSLAAALTRLRGLGVKVGGKSNVLVAEFSLETREQALEALLRVLTEQLGAPG